MARIPEYSKIFNNILSALESGYKTHKELLSSALLGLGLSEDEMSEERRLAYVAITRAKKQLFILHTASRMMYGQTAVNRLSRFAEEIPDEYLKTDTRVSSFGGYTPPQKERVYTSQSKITSSPAPARVDVIGVGTRVRHGFFGEGEVVSAEPMGGDVLYEIQFDNGMNKKLLGQYAKLTEIK